MKIFANMVDVEDRAFNLECFVLMHKQTNNSSFNSINPRMPRVYARSNTHSHRDKLVASSYRYEKEIRKDISN